MKKIRNIHQLKKEKKRIRQRQAELEKQINDQWLALKDTVKPQNLAKQAYGKFIDDKTAAAQNDDSLLKKTIHYGISLLARKFTDKAGEKFTAFFKK